jgi:hypothetical protein
MYVGNGIAYGSIVGLKGREADLQNIRTRGTMALVLALVLQGLALLATFSWLPTSEPPGWSEVLRRSGIALALSLAGTALMLVLFFQISRALGLF